MKALIEAHTLLDQVVASIGAGKLSAEEKVFCVGYLIGAAYGSNLVFQKKVKNAKKPTLM